MSVAWYRWYPNDYARDTALLTLEEDCLYRRLLDAFYLNEFQLPFRPVMLARICCVSPKQWRRLWPAIEHYWSVEKASENVDFEASQGLSQTAPPGTPMLRHSRVQKGARLTSQRAAAGSRGGRQTQVKRRVLLEHELEQRSKQLLGEHEEFLLKQPVAPNIRGGKSEDPPPSQDPQVQALGLVKTCGSDASKPDCPVSKIIAKYEERLVANPRCRVVSEATRKHLRTRWREKAERQSVEWWDGFFGYIAADCPFLVGQSDKPFTPGLDWIVKASNFSKIMNGNFQQTRH